MQAKKSYGQHFLQDENIVRKILAALEACRGEWPVLEVGPGQGVLTRHLLADGVDFRAVEADRDMWEYLMEHYPSLEGRLLLEDFLRLDLKTVFSGAPFVLFGNYPYNISSQILIRMVQFREVIPCMVGMFQKEVADRVVAPAGSRTYGRISVMVQAYYDGKIALTIGPGAFKPQPKVDSAVIVMKRRVSGTLGCDESRFRQVVSLAFSQRRKMMRNTLKSLVNDNDFLQQDVFTRRPEQLTVAEFIQLTNLITNQIQYESGEPN